MSQEFRNASGGMIDRTKRLRFTFNGRIYSGFAGDTLAAALLANGVRIIGRSFKYHRPRGIFGLGAEEPNALVQLGTGARTEPNTKASQIELYEGLEAASQNCWPSVGFDLGAVAQAFSRLLPAGFYYKTFKWPPGWWINYEPFIRGMAGLGKCATEADPDRYEHDNAHCDVLVVGAGPTGLAAARAAGRTGARVLLVDDGPRLGGSLLHTVEPVDGTTASDWVATAEAELAAMPEVRILRRAVAFGYYDHNQIGVLEHVADHRPAPRPGEPRQRLWHVRARQVVLATGAHERSLVFGNNDLPGVMLASAARGYVNRYAVRPGNAAVVVTNNDSAYDAALDLAAGGIEVRAVIDLRASVAAALEARLADRRIKLLAGAAVLQARGWRGVAGVTVAPIDNLGSPRGPGTDIGCDLLCVSGGWSPAVHLHAQARGRPVYDSVIGAFVPGASFQAEQSAGAARGSFALARCIAEGAQAGASAAGKAGFDAGLRFAGPEAAADRAPIAAAPLWAVQAPPGRRRKRFVDLQGDVTDADIALAVREGYRSVEHVKRYTTLGMGTDQGKTGNTIGISQVATALGTAIEAVGTTTFRPPYVPVTIGALAGAEGRHHFLPNRRTAMHDDHVAAGALMMQSGPWLRPQCYRRPGESLDDAARREAVTVRHRAGIADVSTLGKFVIAGPDAATFLDRVYVNRFSNLAVGKCRYGVMLREDGIVFDDGTTTRLDKSRFLMTSTTAQAPLLSRRLAWWHRALWPELDLDITDVTEQWAAIALAGPRSRDVLARLVQGADLGNAALPYMGHAAVRIGGVDAHVLRVSFSGDLAYEIYVPADYGSALWQALLEIGKPDGLAPYGIDALNTLRIEKGHVAGAELDGRVTADDLGLGRMIKSDGDFIGRRSLSRPGLKDPQRWQLVGLEPADGSTPLPPGAKIVDDVPDRYLGEVTSTTWSPMLDRPIGLALVAGGRARHGQRLYAASPLANRHVAVTVRSPHFFDPEGVRLRG